MKSTAEGHENTLKNPLDEFGYLFDYSYDPTSVLDPNLTSSPSPAPAATLWPDAMLDHSSWEPLDTWLLDSPLVVSPSPPPQPMFDAASLSPQPLELLLRAAVSAEAGDYGAAVVILTRLNQSPSSSDPPLQRAAFYFGEALQSLLLRRSETGVAPPSAGDIVRRVTGHKAFADLSPIPHFLAFTANQAILEALPADAPSLHLVDFDPGLGGRWSSLARDLAARRRPAPRVRLTAVVSDGVVCHAEAALAADTLRDFAAGEGIRVSVDVVHLGALALGAVRLPPAEPAAILLSPAALSGPQESSAAILRFVRRAASRVIVLVDDDPSSASSPDRRTFLGGLEHYATIIETLDAAASAAGGGVEPLRRAERAVVRRRIKESVAAWAGLSSRPGPWGDYFAVAGWSPAPMSELAESQAEWLLGRAPIPGYHVERKANSVTLSWQGKELAATSAWRC